MSEFSPENNKEVDRPLVDRINKVEFDTGKHFCNGLDEIERGQYYTESRKLPLHERSTNGDDYTFEEDRAYAENKTVVVTDVDGHNVYVAELFREDDQVLSGVSRLCKVTPEGWILPDGFADAEPTADMVSEMPEGYLTHFDGIPGAEMARLRETVQPPALMTLEATPDGHELDTPMWRSFEDRQNDRTI